MVRSIDGELRGRRVEALRGGGRLTVELSGGLRLTVDNDFRLTAALEVEHFYPGLLMTPSGALAALVGDRITAVEVTMAGALELSFEGGAVLCVPPDTAPGTQAEAWRVSGPDGVLFTAEPGGYLAG